MWYNVGNKVVKGGFAMGLFKSSDKTKSSAPQFNHGPLVKTGPTAGQNRSRNDDGTWRRKRSDAGIPRK